MLTPATVNIFSTVTTAAAKVQSHNQRFFCVTFTTAVNQQRSKKAYIFCYQTPSASGEENAKLFNVSVECIG